MNKQPLDIDQFLPYGEMLRGFMEQPFINKKDLKDLLRGKGVFIPGAEKCDTIPILTSLLLSPDEFDFLRECQFSKEDNPKTIFQSIKWESSQTLIESVPDALNFNDILNLSYSNYTVVASPNFVQVDGNPDHIAIKFQIERNDFSKNWASNKSIFDGSIEFSKTTDGKTVRMVISHTAAETKEVATQTSKALVKHFKSKGYIKPDTKIEKILFCDFSNASRIEYMWYLTKNTKSEFLTFEDVVDLEFSPDSGTELPPGIEWMEKKIDALKLNGKSLHNTFFVNESRFHNFLCLYKVDAKFSFEHNGFKGQCIISVSFPEYSKAKDITSEIEVNVKSANFDLAPKGINMLEIKKMIIKDIEISKYDGYAKYATAKTSS